MTTATERVLARAVVLPPLERAELVEGIRSRFVFPARAEIDAAWARETEARIDAYDRGALTSVPAAMVFEKIEKQYSS
jgi:putative addiction module component (TIGR02574 family)